MSVGIDRLKIYNFRNLNGLDFSPDRRINLILGENGQGKTSILEAIYTLAHLKSFLEHQSELLIQNEQKWLEINADVSLGDLASGRRQLKLGLIKVDAHEGSGVGSKVRKTLFVDGSPIESTQNYLLRKDRLFQTQGFHTVIYHPSDHNVIVGEAQLRRKYLDRIIFSLNPNYLKVANRYLKLLAIRNHRLKFGTTGDQITHELFENQWIEAAIEIQRSRIQVIIQLNAFLGEYVSVICGIKKAQRIALKLEEHDRYVQERHVPDQSDLEKIFRTQLDKIKWAEIQRKVSLSGPHREDWGILREDPQGWLNEYGSQGEIRTALIALKLSEIRLFFQEKGYTPILLIDDFSSELDSRRRVFLMNYLAQSSEQVFVTATEKPALDGAVFLMRNGQIMASEK